MATGVNPILDRSKSTDFLYTKKTEENEYLKGRRNSLSKKETNFSWIGTRDFAIERNRSYHSSNTMTISMYDSVLKPYQINGRGGDIQDRASACKKEREID